MMAFVLITTDQSYHELPSKGQNMFHDLVCLHDEVEWLDSHRCLCNGCKKYGHYFEEGYAIWTKAEKRPVDELDKVTRRKAG